MDAFEKWHTREFGAGEGAFKTYAERAYKAGHAEGFREGLRRAAEIAQKQLLHASRDYIVKSILSELEK